jgi:hypothetical protein
MNDVRGDAAARRIVAERINKGFVDFQAVDRQGLQVGEAAIAGAEIIDQHLMANITQGLQVFPRHHHINQAAFGDLEGNLPGGNPVQCKQPRHDLADARHHHIARCQVDRDIQLRIGPQHRTELFQQTLEDKVGHLANLPGVFRHGDEQVGAGQCAVGAAPAQQRLGADAVAAVEVEDRLIEHLQLAAADCTVKFGVQ